jgi:hypothetical protein
MKGSGFCNSLLLHIFNNSALANIGDASGLQPAATVGSLWVSLHTGDPGAAGNQTTSEAGYTSYARVGVVRSAAGWTVAGSQVSNTSGVVFPQCTGGSETEIFFGVGTASGGAGVLLYSAPLITTYFDFTSESANTLVVPGHSLVVNDPVQVIAMPNGTVPTGIVTGTTYYVKTVAGDSITLSATVGGAALVISSTGAAAIGKIGPLAVSNLITPQFPAGTLVAAVEF